MNAAVVVAVVGRRYVEDDFQFAWLNKLSRFASGVQGETWTKFLHSAMSNITGRTGWDMN